MVVSSFIRKPLAWLSGRLIAELRSAKHLPTHRRGNVADNDAHDHAHGEVEKWIVWQLSVPLDTTSEETFKPQANLSSLAQVLALHPLSRIQVATAMNQEPELVFHPPVYAEKIMDGLPSFLAPFDAPHRSIVHVLQNAADTNSGIEFYLSSQNIQNNHQSVRISYRELLSQSQSKAQCLHRIPGIQRDTIFLLHFDNHLDNVKWFWAVTVAGYLPCVSSAFVDDVTQRKIHVNHLNSLLERPVILANQQTLRDFTSIEGLQLCSIESLEPEELLLLADPNHRADDIAALMLTSGSTGNAKAVCLTHRQMIMAAVGKSQCVDTTAKDVFLNFIVFDHVVNLVEMHLQAILLGAEQVQVQTNIFLLNSILFLELIHKHRVSITFAPNFFLESVRRKTLAVDPDLQNPRKLDLSCLRGFHSGGESNDVQTTIGLAQVLHRYGCVGEIIHPGYGLTESCAGAVWGFECPSRDVSKGLKFASVGKPIPGCSLRVMTEEGAGATVNEIGEVHLSGPMIFSKYYNNPKASEDAFTSDGWFKTGDQGYLDADGHLNLTGRTKELLILWGINYNPHDVEVAIEQAPIAGIIPSFTLVFAFRPQGAVSESYCIIYSPSFHDDDVQARVETHDAICRVASAITKLQPFKVIPLPKTSYHKSSLGKLSRAKIGKAFESGDFQSVDSKNMELIGDYRRSHRELPSTPTEKAVAKIVTEELAINHNDLTISSNIFQLGLTPAAYTDLSLALHKHFNPKHALDVIMFLKDPTVRGIIRALELDSDATENYDPFVPLQLQPQPNGSKTPLWLVHPTLGDVTASQESTCYFSDRPIYGLRSKGVKRGEEFFSSMSEIVTAYCSAIQRTQPDGPYAIAGYDVGSSIAFEVAKALEVDGKDVRFVGAFNGPPHISTLTGNLTWNASLVTASVSHGLIPSASTKTLVRHLWHKPSPEALDYVLSQADPDRLAALHLDRDALSHAADLTANFARMCANYKPTGDVSCIDVFIADPDRAQSATSKRWIDKHMVKWIGFVRDRVRFHKCRGGHADRDAMMDGGYGEALQKEVKAALEECGL
ncbi:MAG: hypothetical protein Q9160_005290 [Pyrenula sp. 1 TL-2023]